MTEPRAVVVSTWVGVGLAVAAAGAAFGPWVRTGRVTRSGFELARSAERLDVVDGTLAPLLLAIWFCVPLLAAVSFTAAAFRHRRMASVSAAVAALFVLKVAVVVMRSPLETEWGVNLGVVAGALCLATIAIDTVAGSRARP